MHLIFHEILCFENELQNFVAQRMCQRYGEDWWDEKVPYKIRTSVKTAQRVGKYSVLAPVRTEEIYYTRLSDLCQIMVNSWSVFSDTFPSAQWLSAYIMDLELTRNRIRDNGALLAHEELRTLDILQDLMHRIDAD